MGLETPAPGLGRIDVNQITGGPPAPVVEPRAVAALTEAFRNGQVTANEIHDRFVNAPAVEARAKFASDPQVLAAAKKQAIEQANQTELENSAIKQKMAHDALLETVPFPVREMQKDLEQAGWPVMEAPNSPTFAQEVGRRFRVLQDYKTNKAFAASDLAIAKDQSIKNKSGATVLTKINKDTNEVIDPSKLAIPAAFNAMFPTVQEYDKAGSPKYTSVIFGNAPGTVAATPQPVQPPPNGPGIPQDMPIPQLPDNSQGSGVPGLVTEEAPPDKPGSEVATRAATFVARAGEADKVFKALDAQGFDPASWASKAQDYFYGPLAAAKTTEKRQYDAAMNGWIQGLLRLESGAAISSKEQSWYSETFFPGLNDPPAVQQQKAALRAGVEQVASAIAGQGNLDSASVLKLNGILEDASKIAPPRYANQAASAPQQNASAPFNHPTYGRVRLVTSPNGRQYLESVEGSPISVAPSVTGVNSRPETLRGATGPSPVVTPKPNISIPRTGY